jgi:polyphosphate glucokinase
MAVLGIDIGGSGIKGNLVDPFTGELQSDRYKIATPQPSTPDAVADVIVEMIEHFDYQGPVGCTFPAIVRRGVALSAANVDESWIGTNAEAVFERHSPGNDFTMLNDADAAGIAEVEFGAAKDRDGVVIMVTFGTGIGSGLFIDGILVPNTELGHLELQGHAPVEDWAAAKVKKEAGLSWETWAGRAGAYLNHLDRLFSPDLFIFGGGVSRRWERIGPHLGVDVETVPAEFENEAGIVGAAMAATRR